MDFLEVKKNIPDPDGIEDIFDFDDQEKEYSFFNKNNEEYSFFNKNNKEEYIIDGSMDPIINIYIKNRGATYLITEDRSYSSIDSSIDSLNGIYV